MHALLCGLTKRQMSPLLPTYCCTWRSKAICWMCSEMQMLQTSLFETNTLRRMHATHRVNPARGACCLSCSRCGMALQAARHQRRRLCCSQLVLCSEAVCGSAVPAWPASIPAAGKHLGFVSCARTRHQTHTTGEWMNAHSCALMMSTACRARSSRPCVVSISKDTHPLLQLCHLRRSMRRLFGQCVRADPAE